MSQGKYVEETGGSGISAAATSAAGKKARWRNPGVVALDELNASC